MARNRGADIVNQMAGELSNTGRWAHLIEAAITEAVAEERARCAGIAREHGGCDGGVCVGDEIAREIEAG